jgi:hypothetical protein
VGEKARIAGQIAQIEHSTISEAKQGRQFDGGRTPAGNDPVDRAGNDPVERSRETTP